MEPNPSAALPTAVVGRVDVSRLERELRNLEDLFTQAALRQTADRAAGIKTSQSLEALAQANKLDLNSAPDRHRLLEIITRLKERAPVIHISFAADPPAQFVQKIVQWLRSEIHPQILLQIGLQPSLAAGCTIRSVNRYFDFSLRRYFDQKRQILINKLRSEQ